MSSPVPIPEDLKGDYEEIQFYLKEGNSTYCMDGYFSAIERIARIEAENAALRYKVRTLQATVREQQETIQRLSAPIRDWADWNSGKELVEDAVITPMNIFNAIQAHRLNPLEKGPTDAKHEG